MSSVETQEARKNTKALFKHIVILFIVTRIILTIIGVTSLATIGDYFQTRGGTHDIRIDQAPLILKTWAMWDSTFYVRIAEDAYPKIYTPYTYNSYGFFPGYPFVVSIVAHIFTLGHSIPAGIFVSSICFIFAAFFLYRLVEEECDKNKAELALYILFLQPFGFIFSSMMSESMFLFFSLLAFWCIKKEKVLLSALAVFAATLVRPVGVILFIPLVVILLKRYSTQNISLQELIVSTIDLAVAPAAALGGIFLYFNRLTGDALAYSHSQALAWGHYVSDPLTQLYNGLASSNLTAHISAYFLLVYSFILLLAIKKLKLEYTLYAWPLLYFHTFTGTVFSSPRYGVVVFPIALAAALLIENKINKKEEYKIFLYISLAMFQAFCFVAWTLGVGFTV